MKSKCDCGRSFPLHLFRAARSGKGSYSHTCLCSKRWRWDQDETEIVLDEGRAHPRDLNTAEGWVNVESMERRQTP